MSQYEAAFKVNEGIFFIATIYLRYNKLEKEAIKLNKLVETKGCTRCQHDDLLD